MAGEIRGPEIKKSDLIEKSKRLHKSIGYDQDGFSWKEQTKIESYLHAQSTDIAMEWTLRTIKTKELAIKELCLGMHARKPKF